MSNSRNTRNARNTRNMSNSRNTSMALAGWYQMLLPRNKLDEFISRHKRGEHRLQESNTRSADNSHGK